MRSVCRPLPTSGSCVLPPSRDRPLTERQSAVLDYIKGYIRAHAYPPTLREIGTHFGIRSTNGVNDHLRALERKGYISREDMKSRAIHVRPSGFAEANVCPTCGRPA